ncbi:MAG TPA: hypothetical protein VF384_17155 [Planctomycetota bacterium]
MNRTPASRRLRLFVLLCAPACTSVLDSAVDNAKLAQVKSVALVPPMIGPLDHCSVPFIPAGISSGRVNGISKQIVDAERSVIGRYASALSEHLRTDLGLQVRVLDARAAWTPKPPPPKVRDDWDSDAAPPPPIYFPVVCERELDPLELTARRPDELDDVDLAPAARALCGELGVDAIAVSYSLLEVTSAEFWGSHVRLDSWLDVVDKEGNYVIRAHFYSDPPLSVSPGDPTGFVTTLQAFDSWIVKLFVDIRSKTQPQAAQPGTAQTTPP